MDKEPFAAILARLKPTEQAYATCAEIDRLKERADDFSSFICALMVRMERAEKGIADLQPKPQDRQDY